MFIMKPNSTGTLCIMDKVFQMLHAAYEEGCNLIRRPISEGGQGKEYSIGLYEALHIICKCWRRWCSMQAREWAWADCGFPLINGRALVGAEHIPKAHQHTP